MWPAGWTLPTPDLVPGKQFQKSQMATPGEGEREIPARQKCCFKYGRWKTNEGEQSKMLRLHFFII